VQQVMDWVVAQRHWKLGEVSGCAIAVPARPLPSAPRQGECRGSMDQAALVTKGERKAIVLSGWSATAGASVREVEASFVELRGAGGNSEIVDTLRIPRPDVNRALGAGSEADFGFSRLLPASLPSGVYSLAIIQRVDGQDIACAPLATLTIP
jgi:hypothetical protein